MKTLTFKFIVIIFLLSFFKSSYAQLPDDFPKLTTTIYGPTAPGKIFLSVSEVLDGVGYYVMMVNNDGTVEKYYKIHHEEEIYDFKIQCDGRLSFNEFLHPHSYVGGGDAYYKFLSNDFTHETDSVQMGNEYIGESHDFQVLPSGHMLFFSYSPEQFDLSALVAGGYPNTKIYATVIQEMDVEGKVVFQWRFWDHFKLSDLKFTNNSAKPEIDGVHTNSIDLDNDGNIIFSSLSLSTITKISRQTGDVLWQLGGKYNMFRFTNIDSTIAVGMFDGHDFRRLQNGNVLFYDNNDRNTSQPSRVIEWKLDEVNLTATKIWEYDSDSILAWHRGNATRLSNGNTFIGWGADDALAGPACTEVDSLGNILFELTFDNPNMSSFRAFRFEFPANVPKIDWSEYELSVGSFNFIQGDTLDSGISLDVTQIQADGYNTLNVKTFDLAPLQPLFPSKAPRVYKHKVLLNKQSIAQLEGKINFDASIFKISNPEEITVYARKFVDQKGLFLPLTTTYNPVTHKIVADFTMNQESNDMEFIFTYPDLADIAIAPHTLAPNQSERVNTDKPVRLEWAPEGFIGDYQLQIATDPMFTNKVVDESYLTSSVFYLENAINNKAYYWRARTNNEAGYSNWSDTARFVTGKPEIEVIFPAGGEVLKRGLPYFIQWKDNITDSVVIDLYKADILIASLDTIGNDIAMKWTVPMELDSTCGYYVVARSLNHPEIMGRSKKTFAILDSSCVNSEFPYITLESPVGEEKCMEGKTYNISWIDNIDSKVNIELYESGQKIADVSQADNFGNYPWTIPFTLSGGENYSILIRSKDDSTLFSESIAFEIADSTMVGISDINENPDLLISPNPTTGKVRLSFSVNKTGPVKIALYSLDGRMLQKLDDKVYVPGKYSQDLNLANFHGKVCLIRMTDENQSITRKIVIK